MITGNIIFSRGSYVVFRVKYGYVIYNTNKKFINGHTHIRNLSMCRVIVDNVLNNRLPKSKDRYIIDSHIRLTSDKIYANELENVIQTRLSKSCTSYINSSTMH